MLFVTLTLTIAMVWLPQRATFRERATNLLLEYDLKLDPNEFYLRFFDVQIV